MNGLQWGPAHSAKAALGYMDDLRRQQGDMLDLAGLGPIETPYRVVHSEAGVSLRRYGNDTQQRGPALLIIPAPIKRPYIWDLSPRTSVVRRCLEHGFKVYLADWMQPDDSSADFNLQDYGDRFLTACAAAVEIDCGDTDMILAAHSLGGVLAAIFTCLHAPRVRALLLLEAPLHFGADAGSFTPLIDATPDARPIGETFGKVPGSFLNLMSIIAEPHAFQWQRYLDWAQSIADPAALDTLVRVERWTQDEFPLPGQFFNDIVELLYRDDQLMKGTLLIGKQQLGPQDVKAPLLNVIDPRSTLIPARSILPFHEAAASEQKKVLQYEGDTGVGLQHVGLLVGANAHARIWPAIFDWLDETGSVHRAH